MLIGFTVFFFFRDVSVLLANQERQEREERQEEERQGRKEESRAEEGRSKKAKKAKKKKGKTGERPFSHKCRARTLALTLAHAATTMWT